MKTLNLRLLLILLAAGVAVGVGVHFLHRYQFQRQLGVFKELAENAEKAGEPLVAADYYRRYHYLVPEDDFAIERYALLLADHGQPGQAILPLIEAVNRQPDRGDLRRRLVDMHYEVGKSADVILQINTHLDPNQQDAELQEMLGVSYLRQHQIQLAETALQRAIELDHGRVEPYGYLAGVQVAERKDFESALRKLDEMVTANPQSSGAHVIRGSFFAEQARVIAAQNAVVKSRPGLAPAADSDEPVANRLRLMMLRLAFEDGETAVEHAAHDAEALVFAAQAAHSAGEFDRARIHAECAKNEYPELPIPYALLADLALRGGDSDAAMNLLREGIENAGREAGLLWNLANLEISEDNVATAQGLIRQLEAQGPTTRPLVTYLNARIDIEAQRWNDARGKLEQVSRELSRWPELARETYLWLGVCYRALGYRDLTLEAFQRATSDDPFWAPGLLGEAAALLESGRREQALEKYRIAASLSNATPAVRLAYAGLAIALRSRDTTAPAVWDAIDQLLDSIREMPNLEEKEQRSLQILSAEATAARGDAESAESLLRAAMESDPQGQEYWLALAALQQSRLDWPAAQSTLDEAQSRFGESVDLRVSRAVYEFSRLIREEGSLAELQEVLQVLSCSPETFSTDESVQLASRIAPLLMYARDFETAETLLAQIADQQPANLQVRLLLFDLALRARSADSMEPILAQVAAIEPDSPIWHYGSAVRSALLAEQIPTEGAEAGDLAERAGHLDAAVKHLDSATKTRPKWQKAQLLRARILEGQGKPDQAAVAYETAIDLGARDPEALLRLISIYIAQSTVDSNLKAKRVLMRLSEEQTPYSAQFARAATQVATELGPENDGLPLLQTAVRLARDAARGSQIAGDHLVLGYLLNVTNVPDEAELEFREAIRLDPSMPETWLQLIGLLVATQRTDDARTALDEALTHVPAEAGNTLAGRAYEMLRDIDLARDRYEQALAAAPEDVGVLRKAAEFYLRAGPFDRAQELLTQLSTSTEPAAEDLEDVYWGRRSLAALLGARGGYQNLQSALSLLEANRNAGAAASDDKRVKAIVLSSMPTRELRAEAIALLQNLVDAREATPQDRFILAQLHLAQAEWYRSQSLPALPDGTQPPENAAAAAAAGSHFRAAMPLLQSAMAADPNAPAPFLVYADALLSRGQASDAMSLMHRIEPFTTNSRAASRIAARILIANRQASAALALVRSRIPPQIDADSAQATLQAAELLEELYAIARDARREQRGSESGEATSVPLATPEEVQAFLDESARLYRELSSLGPRYQLVLSGFESRRGRLDAAVALIEAHAAAAEPEDLANACVHLMREARGETSHLRRAEQILSAAQQQHPESAPILICRADVLGWLEDVETSESLYRQVLEILPGHAAARNNLAFLLAAQGKSLDEALQRIDEVIDVQGPLPELLDTRAYVRMQRGEAAEAITDLQTALKEQRSAVYQFHLAQAQALAEQMESARATWLLVANAKLSETDIHPLERARFRDLSTQLARSGG